MTLEQTEVKLATTQHNTTQQQYSIVSPSVEVTLTRIIKLDWIIFEEMDADGWIDIDGWIDG